MLSWYKSAGPNFTGRQIVLNNKKIFITIINY